MSSTKEDGLSPRSSNGDGMSVHPPIDDAMCWVCHEEGPDNDGRPLRRDCSCRGGTGFAHISCNVGYAMHKSENSGEDVLELSKSWTMCPQCLQEYQGELAVEMTAEFVAFVEERFSTDQEKVLQALEIKLATLQSQLRPSAPGVHLEGPYVKKIGEMRMIANKVLSTIEQMKTTNSLLSTLTLEMEANAHNYLGICHLGECTAEGARASVAYFEKSRDLGIEIGLNGTTEKRNIAYAKSLYEGGDENALELLQLDRTIYCQCAAKYGEESYTTVASGLALAKSLGDAKHMIEAERLLTKLAATSKRVHGPEHVTTKFAEKNLRFARMRWVGFTSRDKGQRFVVLRYEENWTKCVVQGPIEEPWVIEDQEIFTVASEDIHPLIGTPVVCWHLDDQTHLNGEIGEARSFDEASGCLKVHFVDADIEPRPVSLKFLWPLLVLPKGKFQWSDQKIGSLAD